jgi:solute carrier family 25 folate transporter 32
MIASLTTYPHEVIRTRLQTQSSKRQQNAQTLKYSSMRQTIQVIYQEESLRGFYKGLGTNLIRTVPASAVSLLVYELLVLELSWLL